MTEKIAIIIITIAFALITGLAFIIGYFMGLRIMRNKMQETVLNTLDGMKVNYTKKKVKKKRRK
jgi:predicted permease